MSWTYSFLDVQAAITGPGGSFPLAGNEAGIAGEGITIAPTGDKNIMDIGADGAVMHSLSGDCSGKVTVRVQKTSAMNRQLQEIYNYQTKSSVTHGRNIITVRDVARGDTHTCSKVAFAKKSEITYAIAGGGLEWTFDAGKIESQLGSGSPELD